MPKHLLIVESIGKVAKFQKILGPDWLVKASREPIRELAQDGENALGFEFEDNTIHYRFVPCRNHSKEIIKQLQLASQQVETVVLATDADETGEMNAWHLQQALNLKNPQRILYQEITEKTIKGAIAMPKQVNANVVAAGICRAILDKLINFTASPILWDIGASSMGRVESWVLHAICQREREIQSFTSPQYWSISVDYQEGFRAFYDGEIQDNTQLRSKVNGKRGEEIEKPDHIYDEIEAERIVVAAQKFPHQVIKLEVETIEEAPPDPFTTASLQETIAAKRGWPPQKTMEIAQQLYEQGHITYIRTNSCNVSEEFRQSVKQWLQQKDPNNLPNRANPYRQNENERAAEAIRPTEIFKTSKGLQGTLSAEQFDLYVLIWKRAVASQCSSAQLKRTYVISQSGTIQWRSTGQTVEFSGFLRYWDNLQHQDRLPPIAPSQALIPVKIKHRKHETNPPDRFSEPQLIRHINLEEISPPSTYKSLIQQLVHWKYAEQVNNQLQPTRLGMQTDQFLQKAFPDLLETTSASAIEITLKKVAQGQKDWKDWINNWNRIYWEPALSQSQKRVQTYKIANCGVTEAEPQNNSQKALPQVKSSDRSILVEESNIPKAEKLLFPTTEEVTNDLHFWSDISNECQPTSEKSTQSKITNQPINQKTESRCPICQNFLEIHCYQKDGHLKHLIRCSDATSRKKPDHKDAVFLKTGNNWWNPIHGTLSIPTTPQPPTTPPP